MNRREDWLAILLENGGKRVGQKRESSMAEAVREARLLGHVAWDGSTATSERVLLRAGVANRLLVERNRYVRIQDEDGVRSGFLARVITGPFFHRSGSPTIGG